MNTKVLQMLEKTSMLAHGDQVLAGVSGGADSMCLLLLLLELREILALKLFVVHVHHGIRAEKADQDAEFVRSFCEKQGVPVTIRYYDVPKLSRELGTSEEETGRNCRYACFLEEAHRCGATKVCVAHHQDDQAETLLFRMARGTGIRGLCGMSPMVRAWKGEELLLCRPLLSMSREEIEQELAEQGQSYCVDQTNEDNEYDRNRIRNLIMPELKQVNAGACRHLAELAEQAGDVIEWMNAETDRVYARVVSKGKLDARELLREPKALRRECLLRYIRELTGKEKDITLSHVLQVEELLTAQSGKETILPYGLTLQNNFGIVERRCACKETEIYVKLDFPEDKTVMFDKGVVKFGIMRRNKSEKVQKIPKNKCTKWFDYDKIEHTFCHELCVRTRQPGDYFVISTSGGRKSLQDYFVSERVSKEQRQTIPLLAAGQEILWAFGYRTSENFRVSEETETILVVEWEEYIEG